MGKAGAKPKARKESGQAAAGGGAPGGEEGAPTTAEQQQRAAPPADRPIRVYADGESPRAAGQQAHTPRC